MNIASVISCLRWSTVHMLVGTNMCWHSLTKMSHKDSVETWISKLSSFISTSAEHQFRATCSTLAAFVLSHLRYSPREWRTKCRGTSALQAMLASHLVNLGLGKQMGQSLVPLSSTAKETETAAQESMFTFLLKTPFFQSLLGLWEGPAMALSKMFYREKILEAFHIGGFAFQALAESRNGFCNMFCRGERAETISVTLQLRRDPREVSLWGWPTPSPSYQLLVREV